MASIRSRRADTAMTHNRFINEFEKEGQFGNYGHTKVTNGI